MALEVFANQASIAIESAWLFRRLAEGRDRLQAILNSTRDGMVMIDKTGCILVASSMVGEMFGVPSNELAGCSLDELASGSPELFSESRTALLELFGQVLGELTKQSAEIIRGVTRVNEPRRIVERVSVPMLDGVGVPVARLLVLYDVTEQKDAEGLREDMTRMMVHDLRSPLTNIIAALDVLELTVADDQDKHIIELAHEGSSRLLGLISSLLEIGKLEAGQMPLNRKPVAWNRLVETARERVQAIAASDGVKVNVNVPPGIPAEYRERIFQKFFQMPGPRRRRGTGLGLPYSRLAVEAHGGRIWVEDNSGGGGVFVFTLPVVK
jgi:NtrC-family two-component system sensor histidine kinase KinB